MIVTHKKPAQKSELIEVLKHLINSETGLHFDAFFSKFTNKIF